MDEPETKRFPIAFAHRGARAERPENTLEAFSRALELGATGLESDAWITSDGVVVLDHDGAAGPPWRRRRFSESPRRLLPRHVPALEDLYRELGSDYQLSLDVKDPAAFPAVLDVATRAGRPAHLWLCDGNTGRLATWAGRTGGAKLVLSSTIGHLKGDLSSALIGVARTGVAALNLHGSEWNRSRVAAARRAGLLAFGWDAQSEYHIARLVGLGLDAIYSDHVGRLVAVITRATPGG